MSEETSVEIKETHPEKASKAPVKIIAGVAIAGVLVGGGLFVTSQANAVAKKHIDTFIQDIEKESGDEIDINYENVDVGLLNGSVTISDISFTDNGADAPSVTIAELTLKNSDYVPGESFPDSASLTLSNLEIVDQTLLDNLNQELDVDYTDKTINASAGYRFNEKFDQFSSDISFSISDVSDITAHATLSNVADLWSFVESNYAENDGDLKFDYSQKQKFQQLMAGVTGNKVSVEYTNHGEMENMIAMAARENGMSVSEFKAQIPLAIDMYTGNHDLEFTKKLKQFIENPERIALTMEPEEPLTLSQLSTMASMVLIGNSQSVIDKLNLSLSVN